MWSLISLINGNVGTRVCGHWRALAHWNCHLSIVPHWQTVTRVKTHGVHNDSQEEKGYGKRSGSNRPGFFFLFFLDLFLFISFIEKIFTITLSILRVYTSVGVSIFTGLCNIITI